MRHLFTAAVLTACALPALGQDSQPFVFIPPWDDASQTVINVSSLNPAPLEAQHKINVRNGHFFDQTGRRVRFVGTNIGAGAAFPEKDVAVGLARRLRKFGVNCVRLHHMDSPWAQPNLFYFEGGSYGKQTAALDARSLERLDWLIYQLKLNGIYVDLNLHVGRQFVAADGLPDTDKLPELGKVVGYFEPTMIERQKLFARQLLDHVNPHTGLRYADEPSVALIELTNEDSLVGSASVIRTLPEHYRQVLKTGWNQYLSAKYGSTDGLLKAWNVAAKPLGENQVRNGQLRDGTAGWYLEQHASASARMDAVDVAGATNAPPGRALRISELKTDDTGWHLQLNFAGMDLKPGETYTVSFAARAAAARTVNVNARLDQAPWSALGLSEEVSLSTDWQRYALSFQATNDVVPNHARLTFTVGEASQDVYLGDVSVQTGGGGVDLAAGQTLEQANLELPAVGPNPQGKDFAAYLMKVEDDFVDAMRGVIRNEIKAQAPLLCSQSSYGGLGGVRRESRLDVIDMHSYWQHPYFPNQSWDANDYRIDNTPMARDTNGGTLPGLAMHRVEGMPFIVTEYDHPAPSEYAAEVVPLIYAYAAWQDWDGVFTFAYDGPDSDRIGSFFDVGHHPAKMAFYPAAARMLLGQTVSPAPESQTLIVPQDRVPEIVARRTDYGFWGSSESGTRPSGQDWVRRRSYVRMPQGTGPVTIETTPGPEGNSDLRWASEAGGQAVFTLVAPAVKVLIGDPAGRSVELGDVEVAVEPNPRNHVTLALTSMDDRPTRTSESLLLAAVDKCENPGLKWNEPRTFAGESWEHGPVETWAITATVSITTDAPALAVYALDETGARRSAIESTLANGRLTFRISPAERTIWYEIAKP